MKILYFSYVELNCTMRSGANEIECFVKLERKMKMMGTYDDEVDFWGNA